MRKILEAERAGAAARLVVAGQGEPRLAGGQLAPVLLELGVQPIRNAGGAAAEAILSHADAGRVADDRTGIDGDIGGRNPSHEVPGTISLGEEVGHVERVMLDETLYVSRSNHPIDQPETLVTLCWL